MNPFCHGKCKIVPSAFFLRLSGYHGYCHANDLLCHKRHSFHIDIMHFKFGQEVFGECVCRTTSWCVASTCSTTSRRNAARLAALWQASTRRAHVGTRASPTRCLVRSSSTASKSASLRHCASTTRSVSSLYTYSVPQEITVDYSVWADDILYLLLKIMPGSGIENISSREKNRDWNN